jgi:hypothetical protein
LNANMNASGSWPDRASRRRRHPCVTKCSGRRRWPACSSMQASDVWSAGEEGACRRARRNHGGSRGCWAARPGGGQCRDQASSGQGGTWPSKSSPSSIAMAAMLADTSRSKTSSGSWRLHAWSSSDWEPPTPRPKPACFGCSCHQREHALVLRSRMRPARPLCINRRRRGNNGHAPSGLGQAGGRGGHGNCERFARCLQQGKVVCGEARGRAPSACVPCARKRRPLLEKPRCIACVGTSRRASSGRLPVLPVAAPGGTSVQSAQGRGTGDSIHSVYT